jgi:hypothetical protein
MLPSWSPSSVKVHVGVVSTIFEMIGERSADEHGDHEPLPETKPPRTMRLAAVRSL